MTIQISGAWEVAPWTKRNKDGTTTLGWRVERNEFSTGHFEKIDTLFLTLAGAVAIRDALNKGCTPHVLGLHYTRQAI